MRSHGWSGNTPTSDEEAIARILDAADHVIAERGPAMSIADVARSLGVTRQTVYRYFPGTEALLVATTLRSADGFLERLAAHLAGTTDPATAVVEGMAFAIETLAGDRQVSLVLSKQQQPGGSTLTSDTAMSFARAMLHGFDVDWPGHGYDDAALDELAEFTLRVINSFLVDTGRPPRDPAALRTFLGRWMGPAIVYPQLAQTIDTLAPSVPQAAS